MANNDYRKVSVGKPREGGAVFAAPSTIEDAKVPKDATTPLDSAFKPLGYVSEDGLTNGVKTDTEDIKAWGGDVVLTVRTSRSETYSLTLIQVLDPDVLAEVYGPDNVTVKNGVISVAHNSKDAPRRVWVFEIILTGGMIKRVVVPAGQITEVGDTEYKEDEAVGYEVTISAAPDAHGNTAYEYIASHASPAHPAAG